MRRFTELNRRSKNRFRHSQAINNDIKTTEHAVSWMHGDRKSSAINSASVRRSVGRSVYIQLDKHNSRMQPIATSSVGPALQKVSVYPRIFCGEFFVFNRNRFSKLLIRVYP